MAHGAVSRLLAVLVGVVTLGLTLAGLSTSARAAATTGDVYIVHGIVGSTADILVDGNNVAPAAAPKTVVGPLPLAPGDHVVTLREGTDTLVSAQFSVKAGSSSDVVAHRTADSSRQAVVTVFVNDTSPVRTGLVRLVVSHVASAPPADIRVDGTPLFRNVASGESLTLEVPAKRCTIDVVPTLTDGPAILEPTQVDLQPGTMTRVFVVGDATMDTTDSIVQVIPVDTTGAVTPTKVQTGDGGQAADSVVGGGGSGPVSILGGAVLAFAALTLLSRRSGAPPVIGSRHAK